MIEVAVDETDVGSPAERLRCRGVERVRLDLAVLPVEEVVAVRRNPEHVLADQLILEDQLPLAGGGIDSVDVRGRRLVVGDVAARVAPDGPAAVRADFDLAHARIGERHELAVREVERLAISEVAIRVGAGHLHRLNPFVLRVPHVHVRGFFAAAAARRVGRRHLFLRAEEDALVVVAPIDRGAVAQHPALRKSVGLRRIEFHRHVLDFVERRLHARIRQQHVVALTHLVDVHALEHGETGALVVPREAAVHARVVVERRDAAVAQVEDEQAVPVAHGAVDGVGEQIALLVESDFTHTAEELVAPRDEIVKDHVRAAWAGWFRVRSAARCARRAAARRRGRCRRDHPPRRPVLRALAAAARCGSTSRRR